jgi:hypothetical protein
MTRQLRALSLLLVVVGCGRPDDAAAPLERGTSPLEATFDSAAKDYGVPAPVLKAIAYVETRVSARAGLVSVSGGHGMLSIVERADWQMGSRATALTGASLGQLDVDLHANIRGAAAVLRELADRTQLDPSVLGNWYEAVSLYPGFESPGLSAEYAADVFTRLEQGFTVESLEGTVALAPTASTWREHAPATAARRDALGGSDYPAAANFVASPNHYTGRDTYEFVVIHTMQGSFAGTESWFQNPASQVSANYIVRSSDGEIIQMVHDADSAWHVQCYNRRSIGIEHEGYIAQPATWYTEAMYSESAKLTRWLTDKHAIPRNRTHIIGHYEVAAACNTDGHTDPGSGWNWTHYMDLVNNAVPTTSTGVLTGVIYTGGNTANRVAGATVTAGGHSTTADSNGLYTFNLAPGTYTVSVTKAGYGSTSLSRVVTAGATIWGSMDIDPVAATGTLKGVVFAFNAASPSDMSTKLSGATVTVSPGGAHATTAADGAFSFSLAPGTYSVAVTKSGYANNTVSHAVASGQTATVNVGLSSTSGPDVQPPVVAISSPMDNAQLDLGVIEVQGTASDDRGPIASVKLSLNGGAATDVPVTNGAFSVQVQLKPGSNSIEAKATDAAGNSASAIAHATFNAGVKGFVFAGTDQTARLAGAVAELHDAASGALVSTSTADAQGQYALTATVVPADYKLIVRASGYVTHVETVTVGTDQRAEIDVSMVQGTDEGDGSVTLTFTEPADGSVVHTDSVTVYGVVTGFDPLTVTVNGVQGQVLGGGGFSCTVPLVEGANTLTANITGVAGETLSGTLHLTRQLITGTGGAQQLNGGCSATGGLEGLALVGMLRALWRRRRSH